VSFVPKSDLRYCSWHRSTGKTTLKKRISNGISSDVEIIYVRVFCYLLFVILFYVIVLIYITITHAHAHTHTHAHTHARARVINMAHKVEVLNKIYKIYN